MALLRTRLRPLAWFAAALLGVAAGHVAAAPSQPLTFAARVWGLAKYHHPGLMACRVDWDAALMNALPALEAAGGDANARDAALGALLAAAGASERRAPDAQTPAWIVDSGFSSDLQQQLAWLAAQRPQSQCYVGAGNVGQASFVNDGGRAALNPDRARRALAAFRFWNAIEWFFPYKSDIGRDWDDVLDEHLPRVLDAATQRDYVLAMRAFTAQINDSHAFLNHPSIDPQPIAGPPPFQVQLVEGRDIVSRVWAAAGQVRPGDELLTVDGQSFVARKDALRPRGHGSNPAWFEYQVQRSALLGPASGSFRFRRPDGSEYSAQLTRRSDYYDDPPSAQPVWQRRALPGGCTFGVVDMARLVPADVPRALTELADTDALVFDVRNYPNGTLWPIVDRLYDAPRLAARFTAPLMERPGAFDYYDEPIGGGAPSGYRGRILILHDERSISQSEYTVMGLQATGRAVTFGSQTAGADGNITQILLPGALQVTFTGLGVFYPDGRSTQRIGMVPDVHVTPTVAGLAAGRDEVLDAALDCRWRDAQPPLRLPPSGIYYAAARDGEGLDVHRDAHTSAVLSYGYDAAGEPEWLLAAAPSGTAQWSSTFHRHSGGGAQVAAADGFVADFQRGPYAPACAIAEQHALGPRAQWRWPGAPDAGVCQLPLLQSGAAAATGLWGPASEEGWGFSVHHAGDLLTVIVYAYDPQGRPRWLLGQTAWSGQGTATLALQRMQGYCRTCTPRTVERSDAGTLELNLDGVRSGNAADNWATLHAAFAPGAAWDRTRMPLRRLVGATR